jgi:hypothetical protein
MMIKAELVSLAILIIALSSCSIEKRVYTLGYHIEWTTKQIKSNILVENKNIEKERIGICTESTINQQTTITKNTSTVNNSNYFSPLIKKSKDDRVKISIHNIKAKSKNETQSELITNKKNRNVDIKNVYKPWAWLNETTQGAALLLCLFLGIIGIHRFYLGYKRLGLMYLIFATLGPLLFYLGLYFAAENSAVFILSLFGVLMIYGVIILCLIDLIRILIGNLQPANGGYDKNLNSTNDSYE